MSERTADLGMRLRLGRWLLGGLAAHFAVTGVLTILLLTRLEIFHSNWYAAFLVLGAPLSWAGLVHLALGVFPRREGSRSFLREAVATALVFGLLVWFLAPSVSGPGLARILILLPALGGGALAGAGAWRWGLRMPAGATAYLGALLTMALFFVGGGALLGSPVVQSGDIELVSFEPETIEEIDGASMRGKDGYPPMTFRYNRLGFRDAEPVETLAPGQQRILIVGDSFVWGDGIATNEETLGYQLRGALEQRAPGRFVVMSAAYPGLGLSGYRRFVQGLTARYPAAIVVVGYLGEYDYDPVDSQAIHEALPKSPWLRFSMHFLKIARRIHEVSGHHRETFATDEENRQAVLGILEAMSEEAKRAGHTLLFIDYFYPSPSPNPEGASALVLPEPLRYPGHRNAYWYEMDMHPKAKLNRELSGLLATRVLELLPEPS